MGVALYFIDKLALRAGHEKDEDEADTVGCCTLKVSFLLAACRCQAGTCRAVQTQWRKMLAVKPDQSCDTAAISAARGCQAA